MPPALHHAQVFYPPGEEANARQFYTGALGLEEIARPAVLRDRSGIWLAAGAGHVHLSEDRELGLHPRRHFALRVGIRLPVWFYGGRRRGRLPSIGRAF